MVEAGTDNLPQLHAGRDGSVRHLVGAPAPLVHHHLRALDLVRERAAGIVQMHLMTSTHRLQKIVIPRMNQITETDKNCFHLGLSIRVSASSLLMEEGSTA